MTPTRQGSFHLFRLAGIDLYLHWSWFLVAAYQVTNRKGEYTSPIWNAVEYLTLFGIVMMHEFGHALACRQVGGQADLIVLWPLGGVAYVNPPPRPGATLWSIAAGPLVNVALVPVLSGLIALAKAGASPDVVECLRAVWFINVFLLIFNLLPIYPLDGGQILRSLLWFVCGRTRSLLIASALGLAGAACLLGVAIWLQSPWLGFAKALATACPHGYFRAVVTEASAYAIIAPSATTARLHLDRTARGHRDHRNPRGDAVAGAIQREGEGEVHQVPEQ